MNNFGEKVSFIWSIAELLRGPYRPNQYKDVMLPMTVLRRLDCVLDLETGRVHITAQNHGHAVDAESLHGGLEVSQAESLPQGGSFAVSHRGFPKTVLA